ncbi:uncharacterized protein [Panulirus ornatus]|uniref:uncharacterized protein isoform X1 n=1 Tax=Panulirus ornatus TaxID=150431 RepID=UPI003A89A75A
MSVREGTRRKKISVLHMLGTWEGKIEGCNCPSCREWDAGEKTSALASKSPPKVLTKAPKVPRPVAKKVSIKVKTTKVVVDNVQEQGISARKVSLKKHILPKGVTHIRDIKLEQDLSKVVHDGSVFENADCASDSGEFEDVKNVINSSDTSEKSNVDAPFGVDTIYVCDTTVPEDEMKIMTGKEENGRRLSAAKNQPLGSDSDVQTPVKAFTKKLPKYSLGEGAGIQKSNFNQQQFEEKATLVDPLKIKQEPEEYFSDQEDTEKNGRGKQCWDAVKNESRTNKRARMVTSEMENIYAKPRMIFTGRGVVRKFEPGVDRTPKSKRGRKPSKPLIPVKVKQEPKDIGENENEEDEDGSELDQLQRALSEAAESISDVGEELLDALHEFGEDPKKSKQKKKTNTLFKRVDSDGDKYVECNMCFKVLKESSMKQHYKTHTGEKPHTCDECDARFTRKGDVERHKRLVHKNQKPFKCQKCNREFSDRKNLKAHLQNHDKAIYYVCSTCGFKFGKREYYENHIRYIHPLPDGSMPVFPDVDEDLASKQLRQLEMEDSKERKAREGSAGRKGDLCSQDDDDDDDDEEVDGNEHKAMEITVTEGEEQNITANGGLIIKKEEDSDSTDDVNLQNKDGELEDQYTAAAVSGKNCDRSLESVNTLKTQVGTDVRVSKGTLSFTQTLPDTDSQDEDLVNKVIAAAVSQATNTIESLQTKSGANMSGNDVDIGDEEEDEDDEMMEETDDIQEILDSNYDILPIAQVQKPIQQPSEIHVNASVGGQKRKFIIQVPPGSNLNVQTLEGMEMIVSMVNQLCAGKGELDGPIEVVMHNPNTRPVTLD